MAGELDGCLLDETGRKRKLMPMVRKNIISICSLSLARRAGLEILLPSAAASGEEAGSRLLRTSGITKTAERRGGAIRISGRG